MQENVPQATPRLTRRILGPRYLTQRQRRRRLRNLIIAVASAGGLSQRLIAEGLELDPSTIRSAIRQFLFNEGTT